MSGYVEDNNNTIFQVFSEFADFLNCIYYFHTSDNKHIRNMALNSMRLHARAIADFFQQRTIDKNPDDLFYTDFINTNENLSISYPGKIKPFINKSTAHISRKRGNLTFDNKDYFNLLKMLLLTINSFMDRCDDSLKSEFISAYQDEDVKILKEFIQKMLVQDAEYMVAT